MKRPLLTAAAKNWPQVGSSDLDWCAIEETAAWEHEDRVLEAVRAVNQPSDDEIRATALAGLEDGANWLCIEEDGPLASRLKRLMEMAAAQIVARAAAAWLDEQEELSLQEKAVASGARNDAANSIAAALRGRCEIVADGYGGFGSIYLSYRAAGGRRVEIRVSDHHQKIGGGWSQSRGEQFGESDVSFIVRAASDVPAARQVRKEVAAVLCDQRN